jgi:hypothetical protein
MLPFSPPPNTKTTRGHTITHDIQIAAIHGNNSNSLPGVTFSSSFHHGFAADARKLLLSSTTCTKSLDVKLWKVEIANRNHTRKLALKKAEGQE